jgi:GNAT superfamily N-acetyltransferase
MEIKIKPYENKYFDHTRTICYETSTSYHTPERAPILWGLYHDWYVLNSPETCFVATNENDIAVGYILCAPDFETYTAENPDNKYEQYREHAKIYPAHLHIDILPEYQGAGIGGVLLNTLYKKLESMNIGGVHLTCGPKKTNAIKFYLKHGYTQIGNNEFGLVFGKTIV